MLHNAIMHQLFPPVGDVVPNDDAWLRALYAWPDQAWLRSNMVVTLDGAVRDHDGRSSGISSSADMKVFGLLRATCAAILVGAGTVSAEDYSPPRLYPAFSEERELASLPERPVIVIVSNSLNIDPSAQVFHSGPGTTLIATHEGADPDRIARLSAVSEVLRIGRDQVDLPRLLAALHSRGWHRLLTEGGPRLLGALAPWVDEFCLSLSPRLMGATKPPQAAPDVLGGMALPNPLEFTLKHLVHADHMLIGSWLRTREALT